jgi:hypothetical protein
VRTVRIGGRRSGLVCRLRRCCPQEPGAFLPPRVPVFCHIPCVSLSIRIPTAFAEGPGCYRSAQNCLLRCHLKWVDGCKSLDALNSPGTSIAFLYSRVLVRIRYRRDVCARRSRGRTTFAHSGSAWAETGTGRPRLQRGGKVGTAHVRATALAAVGGRSWSRWGDRVCSGGRSELVTMGRPRLQRVGRSALVTMGRPRLQRREGRPCSR